MEAMAAGLPCVASRVRGNTDLIDENGGFLCDSRNPETFAKAIEKLYNNQDMRLSMSQYNREKVNDFCKENVNRMMFAIYQDLLE